MCITHPVSAAQCPSLTPCCTLQKRDDWRLWGALAGAPEHLRRQGPLRRWHPVPLERPGAARVGGAAPVNLSTPGIGCSSSTAVCTADAEAGRWLGVAADGRQRPDPESCLLRLPHPSVRTPQAGQRDGPHVWPRPDVAWRGGPQSGAELCSGGGAAAISAELLSMSRGVCHVCTCCPSPRHHSHCNCVPCWQVPYPDSSAFQAVTNFNEQAAAASDWSSYAALNQARGYCCCCPPPLLHTALASSGAGTTANHPTLTADDVVQHKLAAAYFQGPAPPLAAGCRG